MSELAEPSFFPTPMEIAGGLRWVREHPVVATAAAAAATAVSVLSYLRAAAEERQLQTQKLRVESGAEPVPPDVSKALDRQEFCSSTESDASTPTQDRSSSPRELSVRILRCLESDRAVDFADDCCCVARLLAQFGELEELDETRSMDRQLEQLEQMEGDTASPQWGWYVSTTPPEDMYP
ncbi:hypothetical protein BBJ28_00005078 [Nothophytophthora sp. Chile5]|nr:hypothetical protein BBJ28_00005078 [Nothophytophthora sp. Chile5]